MERELHAHNLPALEVSVDLLILIVFGIPYLLKLGFIEFLNGFGLLVRLLRGFPGAWVPCARFWRETGARWPAGRLGHFSSRALHACRPLVHTSVRNAVSYHKRPVITRI